MTHEEEIKRQNEKIEFLARTNMLYSDWEHRNNQVTSNLIHKGIEEGKINAELRAEIEQLKQRDWQDLTGAEVKTILGEAKSMEDVVYRAEAKLKEKNNG